MIIRKHLNYRLIIKYTWKRVLILTLISTIVAICDREYKFAISFSDLPANILGVALAILIGFRVNSAYERWWEAIKIWSGILNNSRTLGRQIISFLRIKPNSNIDPSKQKEVKIELIYRLISYSFALNNYLRNKEIIAAIEKYYSPKEIEFYKRQSNIPFAILNKLGERLQEVLEEDHIEDFRHMQIDTRLSLLSDSLGDCERLKFSVFPRQYSYYSTFFVALFSFILPFVLVKYSGYGTIIWTIILGFIFYALDVVANAIDKPFENTINDTPMDYYCSQIDRDLRENLSETDLPELVKANNGYLF